MAMISLIFIVFANQVNLQTSLATLNEGSGINSLSEGLKVTTIFPTQIEQIQTTSETTLTASAGNNLNDVGGTGAASFVAPEHNFQAISTIYLMKNKKTNNNKNAREGNVKSFEGKSSAEKTKKNSKESEENLGNLQAEPLVWDNCLETNFKDNPQNMIKPQDMQNDNHDYRYQGSKDIGISLWKKRDAGNLNLNSTAGKAWLEKYNNLLSAKTEERRQQKPELTLVRKVTTTEATTVKTTETTVKTTVHVIPITREVFNERKDIFNTTQTAVSDDDIIASYTEDWFEENDRSKIRFGNLPQKETYLIPALKLEQGFHPFGFMSEFFYLIYPFDFPVGKQWLYKIVLYRDCF